MYYEYLYSIEKWYVTTTAGTYFPRFLSLLLRKHFFIPDNLQENGADGRVNEVCKMGVVSPEGGSEFYFSLTYSSI